MYKTESFRMVDLYIVVGALVFAALGRVVVYYIDPECQSVQTLSEYYNAKKRYKDVKKSYTIKEANLLKKPGGNISTKGQLGAFEIVKIYKRKGSNWFYVSNRNGTGWVSGNSLVRLSSEWFSGPINECYYRLIDSLTIRYLFPRITLFGIVMSMAFPLIVGILSSFFVDFLDESQAFTSRKKYLLWRAVLPATVLVLFFLVQAKVYGYINFNELVVAAPGIVFVAFSFSVVSSVVRIPVGMFFEQLLNFIRG